MGKCEHCDFETRSTAAIVRHQRTHTKSESPTVSEEVRNVELNLELVHDYQRGESLTLQLSQFPEAVASLEALIHRVEAEHIEIYRWLLGQSGHFPVTEPYKRYAWRTELRERLPAHIQATLQDTKGDSK